MKSCTTARFLFAILLLGLCGAAMVLAAPGAGPSQRAVVLEIEGTIGPVAAQYFRSGLRAGRLTLASPD